MPTGPGASAALVRDPANCLPGLVEALRRAWPPGDVRPRRWCSTRPARCSTASARGWSEQGLADLGLEVRLAARESHLCCGSAGTYSVLQPELATALRDRKLGHLSLGPAEVIVSANIGCIQHLQSGTSTPVRHWVEVLDEALVSADPPRIRGNPQVGGIRTTLPSGATA